MDFLVKVSEVINSSTAHYIQLLINLFVFIHIDINECSEGSHNCTSTQDCRDIVGSFDCPCKDGYEVSVDGSTCVGMYLYTWCT